MVQKNEFNPRVRTKVKPGESIEIHNLTNPNANTPEKQSIEKTKNLGKKVLLKDIKLLNEPKKERRSYVLFNQKDYRQSH